MTASGVSDPQLRLPRQFVQDFAVFIKKLKKGAPSASTFIAIPIMMHGESIPSAGLTGRDAIQPTAST
jgi:hypothetical protein